MTNREKAHYHAGQAEEALRQAWDSDGNIEAHHQVAAQVHATLAQAFATLAITSDMLIVAKHEP